MQMLSEAMSNLVRQLHKKAYDWQVHQPCVPPIISAFHGSLPFPNPASLFGTETT